jgi:hypothetical protein
MKFADRLKVTASGLSSQTLAVGAVITMGAAVTNCRTLAQAISDGAANPFAIKVGDTGVTFNIEDGTAWQDCECTINSNTQITVTKILNGSNGTSAATFTSSTPQVYNCVPSDWLSRVPVDNFPTSFVTSVPLTQIGTAHMPRQQVGGNLTFSPMAGAVKGSYAEYPLVYDGSSTLTFAGFTEHGSSFGVPTAANIPFTVWFWYDGYTYWWSGSQAATPVAVDLLAPTAGSAAVANATPSVVSISASETLDTNFVPAASAFTVTNHTVQSVAVNGGTISLTVTPAFAYNDPAQTVTYTQPATNGLRDLAGNLMASFSTPLPISNGVGAPVTAPGAPTIGTAVAGDGYVDVAFTPPASNGGAAITGYTATLSTGESATGTSSPIRVTAANGTARTAHVTATNSAGTSTASAESNSVTPASSANGNVRLNRAIANCTESSAAPWTYTGTGGSGTNGTVGAISTVSKPSGVNGAAIFKVNAVANDLMVQISATSVVDAYTANDCIWNSGGTWKYIPRGGSVTSPATAVAAATNDLLKIEHTNADTAADFAITTVFSVSKDNGNTWTQLGSVNNGRKQAYYAKVVPAGASILSCVSATGYA